MDAALYGGITIEKGRVVETNFPDYDMVRMADAALGRDGDLFEGMRRLYGRQLINFPTYAQSLRAIGRGAEVDVAITL